MCVGLPARVESIEENRATVDCLGARRQVTVELVDGVKPGDYVMIHAGIAIARITVEEAEETSAIMRELEEMRGG